MLLKTFGNLFRGKKLEKLHFVDKNGEKPNEKLLSKRYICLESFFLVENESCEETFQNDLSALIIIVFMAF